MKIRSPRIIKAVAWVGLWLYRLWMGSIRYREHCLGPAVSPHQAAGSAQYIYCFWHENLMQPVYRNRGLGIGVLISQHADGQILAEICERLNYIPIRGSTTRGGTEALRQLLRQGRRSNLGLTPDGPLGPPRQVQMGLIYLASMLGLKIVPMGLGADRPWRLNTWDRFVLPRPFSRGTCVYGEPISVPSRLDRDRLEHYRSLVEQAVNHVTDLAQEWADTGDRELLRQPKAGRNWEESARRAAG